MKLTVLQKDISPKLSIVNRFVSTRAQLPILSNVKLKTDKSKLILSATNLEMSVSIKLGASVETDGEITLPAKALYELVSNMNDQIMIEAIGETAKVVSEEFNSSIAGINTGDFPDVPQEAQGVSLSVPAKEFSDNLSKVLFSTSPDDTRPALSGVLFIIEKQTLTMVSSDGFRLSRISMPLKNGQFEDKIILPKTAIVEIAKLIDKENGDITISFDKENSQMIAAIGDIVVSSRIIEGEYPNFEKIIPQSFATQVSVDRLTFLKHIKTAAVFARDGSSIVTMVIEDSELILEAESTRLGTHKSRMPVKSEGEKAEIKYNYKYVEEFLNAVSGEDLTLEFTNSAAAGVFKDSALPNYLHLVMPVRS